MDNLDSEANVTSRLVICSGGIKLWQLRSYMLCHEANKKKGEGGRQRLGLSY